MKSCSRCNVEKPVSEFSKDKRRKSGIGGMCRQCKKDGDFRRNGQGRPTVEREPNLNVLSLGAGVQSSTLIMMSENGDLPPLDYAIFADTQWEPIAVYENLTWLESHTSIPIVRVTAGDVRENEKFYEMPLFNEGGGMLKRQCTSTHKIAPIRKHMYDYVNKKVGSTLVRQWIGISADESLRMKDSNVMWIENWYPLVEQGITREDCKAYMKDHGYPEPPRSACIGCPYHSGEEWRSLTNVEWREATDYDEGLRGDGLYLHRSSVPLVGARLDGDGGWNNECEGMCGV